MGFIVVGNPEATVITSSPFFIALSFNLCEVKEEKAKRPKPRWKLKELDSGRFGELIQNLDISPDNETIIYPKYHYGENQSLLLDICKYELKTNEIIFLTHSMRANYPKFSPDGKDVLFVSHKNSNSQLFLMKNDGSDIRQLTNFSGDIQIITPSWSPNGDLIAFSKSKLPVGSSAKIIFGLLIKALAIAIR